MTDAKRAKQGTVPHETRGVSPKGVKTGGALRSERRCKARSAHDALDDVQNQLVTMGGGWVLEVDFRKYVDTHAYYGITFNRDALEWPAVSDPVV